MLWQHILSNLLRYFAFPLDWVYVGFWLMHSMELRVILNIWNLLWAIWIHHRLAEFLWDEILDRNYYFIRHIWCLQCWWGWTSNHWVFCFLVERLNLFQFYMFLTLVWFWNFLTFLIQLALNFSEPSNLLLRLVLLPYRKTMRRIVTEHLWSKPSFVAILMILVTTCHMIINMRHRLHNETILNGG